MGDLFASLLDFLLSNVDRKSGAKSGPRMLLAAVVLGGLGALLWRYPDPAEMVARRFPALALFGLGALCAAWALFLFVRQRPRTLPADRVVIGIARLHAVGGERADAIGGEAAEDLYHALREARAAGAPIDVRRVYARVPEGETDEERMEAARSLARQPNVRVHLLVWGDAVAGRRRRFLLHTAAGEWMAAGELRDSWAREYLELARAFPDLTYAEYLLGMCGDAFYAAGNLQRALAYYGPLKNEIAAVVRGSVHVDLAEAAASREVAGKHLRRALSELERVVGARTDLAALHPCGVLRGEMEWEAVFTRLYARGLLAGDASVAERAILVPRLQDEYRTALSHARVAKFEGSAVELKWLQHFTLLLQRFPLAPENLHEALDLADRIFHARMGAGDGAGPTVRAGVAYLTCVRDCFTATRDGALLERAERVLREAVKDVDPAVAEPLLDLCEVELGLKRVPLDDAVSAQERLPGIIAACGRLMAHPLVGGTAGRGGLLFSLGIAHNLLADAFPPSAERRAARLAAAEALETARQSQGSLLNVEGVNFTLGAVYLSIALDQLDVPADAAQFALLARSLLEGVLSDPSMLMDPENRAVAHYNLALSLWAVALHRAGERPVLLQQAREHARAAAALGIDPAPLFERLDALGTSPEPQPQPIR